MSGPSMQSEFPFRLTPIVGWRLQALGKIAASAFLPRMPRNWLSDGSIQTFEQLCNHSKHLSLVLYSFSRKHFDAWRRKLFEADAPGVMPKRHRGFDDDAYVKASHLDIDLMDLRWSVSFDFP